MNKYQRQWFDVAIKTITMFNLFVVGVGVSYGQNMLIEQVAGKEIIRKNYNKEGKLESKQLFRISPLDTIDQGLQIKINIKLFDEDGKLLDRYVTSYICHPAKTDVILSVFPFARQNNADYVIEVASPEFKGLYNFSSQTKKLDDLKFAMKVNSGLLGFFGSKNLIAIKNRNLTVNDFNFIIKSNLTIDAYLWGIRVKRIRYKIEERLNSDKTLVSQKFTNEDGSYFFMDYKH